mmetsp:Transcript_25758/g.65561  ORF Transcript_25758/g.65561 Transcript_25758/m.65561 type:complete len:412 (-) Transcript_25758:1183-2418(-)
MLHAADAAGGAGSTAANGRYDVQRQLARVAHLLGGCLPRLAERQLVHRVQRDVPEPCVLRVHLLHQDLVGLALERLATGVRVALHPQLSLAEVREVQLGLAQEPVEPLQRCSAGVQGGGEVRVDLHGVRVRAHLRGHGVQAAVQDSLLPTPLADAAALEREDARLDRPEAAGLRVRGAPAWDGQPHRARVRPVVRRTLAGQDAHGHAAGQAQGHGASRQDLPFQRRHQRRGWQERQGHRDQLALHLLLAQLRDVGQGADNLVLARRRQRDSPAAELLRDGGRASDHDRALGLALASKVPQDLSRGLVELCKVNLGRRLLQGGAEGLRACQQVAAGGGADHGLDELARRCRRRVVAEEGTHGSPRLPLCRVLHLGQGHLQGHLQLLLREAVARDSEHLLQHVLASVAPPAWL